MAARTTKKYTYSVGRRKTAVARVRILQEGKGDIIVNEKAAADYFPSFQHQKVIHSPISMVSSEVGDITIRVVGGGPQGQAEAVRLGIARGLVKINPEFRMALKKAGFLRRDPRKKERKKPGLRRARRARQWSKR